MAKTLDERIRNIAEKRLKADLDKVFSSFSGDRPSFRKQNLIASEDVIEIYNVNPYRDIVGLSQREIDNRERPDISVKLPIRKIMEAVQQHVFDVNIDDYIDIISEDLIERRSNG